VTSVPGVKEDQADGRDGGVCGSVFSVSVFLFLSHAKFTFKVSLHIRMYVNRQLNIWVSISTDASLL
jgi:hypothetical protein